MVSTDLVLRGGTDVPEEFTRQLEMATKVAQSGLLPAHLRDKPANVLVILAGARALNISWFWATQSLYVVEGKLSYSAELMRALVIRAGHKFRILQHDYKVARVEIVRSDDPDSPFVFEFTIEEAKTAELTGKSTWKRYGKAMLLARATSGAVRACCPDVLFGVVYTPEELGAKVDESGEPETTKDGKIVLDGDVVSTVEVPQEIINRIGAEITEAEMKSAASTFVMAMEQGYLDLIPEIMGVENDRSIRQLWISRLDIELSAVKDREGIAAVWKLANGTRCLDTSLPFGDMTVNELINKKLEAVKKSAEPVQTVPVQAESVEKPVNQDSLSTSDIAVILDADVIGETTV